MTTGENDIEIGQRLKSIRTSRQLSQRGLARRSGVANATISQIESGRLNPTVSLLKKILDGLPMSLSAFFTYDAVEDEKKIYFSASELIEITKGSVSYRQIGGNLNNKAIQLLHEVYSPGASTGRRSLKHKGEECGYILRGSLTVNVGKQSRSLHVGEAYYFNSELPHSFANEGDEPCELISACTPPSF